MTEASNTFSCYCVGLHVTDITGQLWSCWRRINVATFLLPWLPACPGSLGVCVCPPYLVCSKLTLMFLQVLEPFCPLSEQGDSDQEEVEVIQPASSATVLLESQTESNPFSLSPKSSAATQKDLSCCAVRTETNLAFVPLSAMASSSFSDTDAGLPLPPPFASCTSDPQPHSGSASPDFISLSDSHSGAHSVEDDSTLSHPPNPPPFTDMITIHPSKNAASEPSCPPSIT